ncbi:MAG: hypothetical protein Q8K96_15005 [Rubrivivax sp.]|nr:hypothetical protein [Rubrivivax sp.]
MNPHPAPPFDTWQWLQACHETWQATLDPARVGRRFRRARLARLIATAQRDSPLYARRNAGAQELSDFAPVTRAELMHQFNDWATDRRITREAAEAFVADPDGVADAWLGRYLLWTSLGSGGEPGLFVQDAASLAAYEALDALRLRAADPAQAALGLWGLGRRFAYVGAIGGHRAGHASIERLRRVVPAAWAPQVDVLSAREPLPLLAERLQALQPGVLITHPSCAAALAGLQAQGELHLRLDELWLGGEPLMPAQRERLHGAFGCTVRNSYGSSEFRSIAYECRHGSLHLNDDWVILEAVDEHWRAVPPGVLSHTTLLTNLANLTQPLLRCELPDRVRFLTEPCPCGSALPVIEVQGRATTH